LQEVFCFSPNSEIALYNIEVAEEAKADLNYYTVAERRIVVSQIMEGT
jgi:hypothetical protein